MNDNIIISLFFERSQDAISQTQEKYGCLCRHIVRGVLSCDEDIEECINDTWLAVWNAIPPERPDKLSAFVCKVAKNLALKKYSYITAQRRNPNMESTLTELQDCIPCKSSMEQDLEGKETISHINSFLRRLSFNDRNIFLRKYFVGDSIAQIAKTFSFSESKVKSSLHRTRGKLKIHLTEKGVAL